MTGLYKAKSKKTGEWVEGSCMILDWESDYVYIVNEFPKASTLPITIILADNMEMVNKDTLCQYIGKYDDNFEKIMEHDVISINTYDYMEPAEDFFGEVVYCEAWACWCIKQPDDEKPIPLCECEGSYKTEIKIHGNVFDNPDLIRTVE